MDENKTNDAISDDENDCVINSENSGACNNTKIEGARKTVFDPVATELLIKQSKESKEFTIKMTAEIKRILQVRHSFTGKVLDNLLESFHSLVDGVVELSSIITCGKDPIFIDLTKITEENNNQTDDNDKNKQICNPPEKSPQNTRNVNYIEQHQNLFFMQENPSVTLNTSIPAQIGWDNIANNKKPPQKPKIQTYRNRRKDKAVNPVSVEKRVGHHTSDPERNNNEPARVIRNHNNPTRINQNQTDPIQVMQNQNNSTHFNQNQNNSTHYNQNQNNSTHFNQNQNNSTRYNQNQNNSTCYNQNQNGQVHVMQNQNDQIHEMQNNHDALRGTQMNNNEPTNILQNYNNPRAMFGHHDPRHAMQNQNILRHIQQNQNHAYAMQNPNTQAGMNQNQNIPARAMHNHNNLARNLHNHNNPAQLMQNHHDPVLANIEPQRILQYHNSQGHTCTGRVNQNAYNRHSETQNYNILNQVQNTYNYPQVQNQTSYNLYPNQYQK